MRTSKLSPLFVYSSSYLSRQFTQTQDRQVGVIGISSSRKFLFTDEARYITLRFETGRRALAQLFFTITKKLKIKLHKVHKIILYIFASCMKCPMKKK